MAVDSEEARLRAEEKFKKAQKAAVERDAARADYEEQGRAARANAKRLKALRLAKEAADEKAKSAAAKSPKRKSRASAKNSVE